MQIMLPGLMTLNCSLPAVAAVASTRANVKLQQEKHNAGVHFNNNKSNSNMSNNIESLSPPLCHMTRPTTGVNKSSNKLLA